MVTVTIDESGQIDVPEAVLQESRIQAGSQLIIGTGEGMIRLIDKERFQQQLSEPMRQVLAHFRRSLARDPQAPFFGGLTFDEYAALSDEEEQALWDRLSAEAHEK